MKTLPQLIDLSNKTAVVTGGAKGIGLGIVNRLHEAGANLVIADTDQASAQKVAETLNTKRPDSSLAIQVDVSKPADVKSMVTQTVDTFTSLDILVNNAGIFPNEPLADMNEAEFMRVIDVNLRGVFLCTKLATEQMKAQGKGGKVINITSIDALHPSMIGLSHYDASKHGVWGFTKNVARELAKDNIWVNAIAPGGVATPGVAALQDPSKMPPGTDMKAVVESFLSQIPMRRMGEPDEIGRVALFLASDLSSYMTGSQIVVDGGALLT